MYKQEKYKRRGTRLFAISISTLLTAAIALSACKHNITGEELIGYQVQQNAMDIQGSAGSAAREGSTWQQGTTNEDDTDIFEENSSYDNAAGNEDSKNTAKADDNSSGIGGKIGDAKDAVGSFAESAIDAAPKAASGLEESGQGIFSQWSSGMEDAWSDIIDALKNPDPVIDSTTDEALKSVEEILEPLAEGEGLPEGFFSEEEFQQELEKAKNNASRHMVDALGKLEGLFKKDGGIPHFQEQSVTVVNDNKPFFTDMEYVLFPFELYSTLDGLGRCGIAYANICKELMPTEERGEIGSVHPTGWQQAKYESIKDKDNPAGYLYNRCHLIAFCLAGENANPQNLITGTRYFNVTGMEPYELQVQKYVKETGHHVLYRVTPVFVGNDLLATGVLIEAASVEDEEISICVFVHNIQPGIQLDYATGESREASN